MRVADLLSVVDGLAPFALAEPWDNVGLLVGRGGADVTGVMVALDARLPTVIAAADAGCEVLLTHHPVIFPHVATIIGHSAVGRVLQEAILRGVHLVAAHTNLDAAAGGLNDALAGALGMSSPRPLSPHPSVPDAGLGRVGDIVATTTVGELAVSLGAVLGCGPLWFTGDARRVVHTVACCTGSGAGLIDAADDASVDVYVTGDLKYHDADRADGMALIQAPHAATEDWALRSWVPALNAALESYGVRAAMAPASTDPWSQGRATL